MLFRKELERMPFFERMMPFLLHLHAGEIRMIKDGEGEPCGAGCGSSWTL